MRYMLFALMLAAVSVVSFAGCTTMTGESAGQNLDDANITATVKTKLAAEDASTLTRVGVQTIQGTVYLTGIVPTETLRERATDVAMQVRGVRSVVNNIRIHSSS